MSQMGIGSRHRDIVLPMTIVLVETVNTIIKRHSFVSDKKIMSAHVAPPQLRKLNGEKCGFDVVRL
jgi:hypothetical protein